MAPGFVLRSKEFSTYRRGYASGSFSPAALPGQGASRIAGVGGQKVARLSCRVKSECQEAPLSCDMEFVFNGTSTAVQFRSLIPLFV